MKKTTGAQGAHVLLSQKMLKTHVHILVDVNVIPGESISLGGEEELLKSGHGTLYLLN